MSRSYLHDSYQKKRSEEYCNKKGKNSSHQQDEAPKNKVSKFVSMHGGDYAYWMEDATSYGGHKRQKGGHRMVNGIVRSKVKEEIKNQIEKELEEDGE